MNLDDLPCILQVGNKLNKLLNLKYRLKLKYENFIVLKFIQLIYFTTN